MPKTPILLSLSLFATLLSAEEDLQKQLSFLTVSSENQQIELKMQQEQINRLQDAVDSLSNPKKLIQAASTDPFVTKNLKTLQDGLSKIVTDLQALKNQGNQSAKNITSTDTKIATLEKKLETQAKALTALCQALEIDVDFSHQNKKSITVKPGDSLGEIARSHGTTIKKLKEMNKKTNDLIYAGEVLDIP